MAYIILSANGEEIDRVPLERDLVMGRSPECDVSIRDVLMSRRHMRLEYRMGSWCAIDLNSKNGMRLGWERVRSARLREGDQLRIGRTVITFHAGPFVPAEAPAPRRDKLVRPADPFEALSGTVTDFVLEDQPDASTEETDLPELPVGTEDDAWNSPLADLPGTAQLATPRPRTDHWTPSRPLPHYGVARRRSAATDLSLQVDPALDTLRARPALIARMSDQALFLAIFMTVLSLLSGGMLVATWVMAG